MYLRCHTQVGGGTGDSSLRPALGTVGTSVIQQGDFSLRMLLSVSPKCEPRGMKTGLYMNFKCTHRKTVSSVRDKFENLGLGPDQRGDL